MEILRTWQGDDGKKILEIARDGERLIRLCYPLNEARSSHCIENNLRAMEILAQHDLPGPRLIAENQEEGWIETTYCGEPLEDLIVKESQTAPAHCIELVKEASELLFTYSAVNQKELPAEIPVPMRNAAREFEPQIRRVPAYRKRAEKVWQEILGEMNDLVNLGPFPQGFTNLDPHLQNFVIDESGQLAMIDFDSSRTHYDPYYSVSFLSIGVDARAVLGEAAGWEPTQLQRAVLAGVDWSSKEASKRFAVGITSVAFGSLLLELSRTDIPEEWKLHLCEHDLKDIPQMLQLDWIGLGQECRSELERPHLSDKFTYVPFAAEAEYSFGL